MGTGGTAEQLPVDAADLMTRLSDVDEAEAAQVLVGLMSTTMAYGGRRRYEEDKVLDIVKALTRLLGHAPTGGPTSTRRPSPLPGPGTR